MQLSNTKYHGRTSCIYPQDWGGSENCTNFKEESHFKQNKDIFRTLKFYFYLSLDRCKAEKYGSNVQAKKLLSIPRYGTSLENETEIISALSKKKFSFNSVSTYSCLIAPLWKFCYVVCFEFCWIYVIIGQRSEKYNFFAQYIYPEHFAMC